MSSTTLTELGHHEYGNVLSAIDAARTVSPDGKEALDHIVDDLRLLGIDQAMTPSQPDWSARIQKITQITSQLDAASPVRRSLQKLKEIFLCQLALATENPQEASEALGSVKDIDLRMATYQSVGDTKQDDVTNHLHIDQCRLTETLSGYRYARDLSYEKPRSPEGFCEGLAVLYGYYQFLEKKDDFFDQIESAVMTAREFKRPPADSDSESDSSSADQESQPVPRASDKACPCLANKRYDELTPDEKLFERLYNDIWFLQEWPQRYGWEALRGLRWVSDKPEIRALSSQFSYASQFYADSATGCYETLTNTLMAVVNMDESPKYLLMFTGNHVIGVFFRNGRCWAYDPNELLPILPKEAGDRTQMSDLTQGLTESLGTGGKPIALSVEVISNERLRNVETVSAALSASLDTGMQASSYNHYAPLHVAARQGHLGAMEALLSHEGVNVNCVTFEHETPLYLAAVRGREAAVELLLKNDDVDVNRAKWFGRTPLHDAVERGYLSIIQALLRHPKIDPNRADANGSTVLHLAASKGFLGAVQELLNHKEIDPHILDSDRKTPLHRACWQGSLDVVKELLKHPADDLQQKDKCDCYPIDIARFGLHWDVAEELQKHCQGEAQRGTFEWLGRIRRLDSSGQ